MFGSTFFHGTIKKYVTLFGTLFNDIYINRVDSADENVQTIKVPLNYGPKEKFLSRLGGDPLLSKEVAIVLPRMSFEIINYSYDSTRKNKTIDKMYYYNTSNNRMVYEYNPVPYNIDFELAIMVKSAEDGTRIVEQILPYFTPEWSTTITVIPEMDLKLDVPIVLNGVNLSDTYEGDYINRRAIVWTLSFTLKGYFYGPTKKTELIKKAITNFFVPNTSLDDAIGNTDVAETVTITPGLDANGDPTTNTLIAIDYLLVNPGDNYDFIVDFESYV
jgi:hypothetical protein